MRVTTGSAKGRALKAPAGLGTRPMLDAQKQMLFNVLGGRVAASRGVFDLFAGSGALGLEALSRGAARAVFVERGREARACVVENVAKCGFDDRARVVSADVFRLDYGRLGLEADLIFCDPPFPLFAEAPARLARLLEDLAATPAAVPGAVLMWRMPEEAAAIPAPPAWVAFDRRVAGRSILLLYEKRA